MTAPPVRASIDPRQSFPELEQTVAERWAARDVFQRSMEQREGAKPWVFWEGPPTANGRPGVHHILGRVFKDVFPRFQTMRGHHVERRGGWDCHGLPVEIAVEKQLGLSSKHDIENIVPGDVRASIERFNAACRESVFAYIGDWDRLTRRVGMWIDLERAYRTMDASYVSSIWSALKTMDEKGLLYQGNKVVPFCTRCGTALSSHEVAQGYEDIKDTSAYVRFPVVAEALPLSSPLRKGDSLVVWTTTPWTLWANVAAAVGPDVEYVRVSTPDRDGERRVVVAARELVEHAFGEDAEVLGDGFPGSALEGTVYEAPFVAAGRTDAGYGAVIAADFVSTDSGTGVVHLAPAFGQDDFVAVADAAAKRRFPAGTAAAKFDARDPATLLNPVRDDGTYDETVTDVAPQYADRFVKDLDLDLVTELADRGLLQRKQRYEHSYPHCWRCGTPLIYYARPSWYLATETVRDGLLAANDTVTWHPPHIKEGRFGEWLRGNVDWAISRSRYWGTPLPIWQSTTVQEGEDLPRRIVVGSLEELAERSGVTLEDPHRPFVDDVTFQEDGLTFERIPEVLDVWFDSGAMPFAQDAAPQDPEGLEHYEAHRIADYVCEGLDQTRGFFYSLIAESVLLRDEAPYKNVLCLGLILDENGQKMSKSKGNVVDPFEALDRFGADALRWYFFTSKQPWEGYRYSDEAVRDGVRLFLLPLWNTASFYAQYAAIAADAVPAATPDTEAPAGEETELDRWIVSRMEATTAVATEALDAYDVTTAGRAIGAFVDELSNWYVRRSRRRFWDGDPVALGTLREALVRVATLLAPLAPFVSDELYVQLGGTHDSVHLADWPAVDPARRDEALEADMATARETVRLGLAARAASGLNVRQPLRKAVVVATGDERAAIERLTGVITDELNVKALEFVAEADELGRVALKPNLRSLGPRFGKAMGTVRAAIEGLDGTRVAAALREGEPVVVQIDGAEHELTADDLLMSLETPDGYQLEREGQHAVALDLEVDDALRAEGLARAVLRQVQVARQDAGFEVTDRIELRLGGDAGALDAVRAHEDHLLGEVLAASVAYEGATGTPVQVDGRDVVVQVTRV
ncbi:isoleucine--tRNA ligase [Patulibacter minatonensis]|uniref:isoleucine--tRNA ligase n=1 Tax=Patulibacter minatonensis TaxID=298163 RepID=UPI00047ABF10|nr:isoleucine--tRNA ligase [Patulibacter minatonensis]